LDAGYPDFLQAFGKFHGHSPMHRFAALFLLIADTAPISAESQVDAQS